MYAAALRPGYEPGLAEQAIVVRTGLAPGCATAGYESRATAAPACPSRPGYRARREASSLPAHVSCDSKPGGCVARDTTVLLETDSHERRSLGRRATGAQELQRFHRNAGASSFG